MGTTVAKKRAGKASDGGNGGGPQRNTAPIQVERDLARMIAVIASHDGITQAALVSPHLRPFIVTHYERVTREMQAEVREQRQKPGE